MQKIEGELVEGNIIKVLDPNTKKMVECKVIGTKCYTDCDFYFTTLDTIGKTYDTEGYPFKHVRKNSLVEGRKGQAIFSTIDEFKKTVEAGEYYIG